VGTGKIVRPGPKCPGNGRRRDSYIATSIGRSCKISGEIRRPTVSITITDDRRVPMVAKWSTVGVTCSARGPKEIILRNQSLREFMGRTWDRRYPEISSMRSIIPRPLGGTDFSDLAQGARSLPQCWAGMDRQNFKLMIVIMFFFLLLMLLLLSPFTDSGALLNPFAGPVPTEK
jgi:hypothetical protein